MAPLVQVDDLVKHYSSGGAFARKQVVVKAVDGVSFTIAPGETLGLVGESGSGKSTVGRAGLRREVPTEGTVRFEGTDLATLKPGELREIRKRMQIVFQ
ncbi:MAG: ATP-binding cassette domain-containing protein, partial [Gemmatimonadota bacterium]